MTYEEGQCRRCLLKECGKEETLREIEEKIAKLSETDKTPPLLYADRLKICKLCSHLLGGTCIKCGCYPEFRAAFIKNRCPCGFWENK